MKMYKRSRDPSDRQPANDCEYRRVPDRRTTWLAILAVLAMTGILDSSAAEAQPRRFGDSPLQRTLARPVTLSWHGQTLGPALGRLGESQAIPLWIDRRIDVAASLDMDVRGLPLIDALNQVAAAQQGAATPFRGVVYFCPAQTAGELATLAARAKLSVDRLPADRREKWQTAAPWSFPRLSQPRQLLEQLAAAAGARVEHADRVPHDLWAAQELPALAAIDRAVLLLAGFDLTCEIADDGATLRVAPITRPVAIERDYAPPAERRAAFDAVLAENPEAVARWTGDKATVAARVETHDQLRRALAGRLPPSVPRPPEDPPDVSLSRQAFTLKIDNRPVGAVLDQLASQLNLKLAWADSLGPEARTAATSCDVRNATLDELLQALLAPAGLAFERTDRKVEIRRRE